LFRGNLLATYEVITSILWRKTCTLCVSVAARYWMGKKVNDYQNTSFGKYEKEINPRLKLSNREKPVSKSSAKKAFKELENITDWLRLEYNDGTA
jgi:hypothetical protein